MLLIKLVACLHAVFCFVSTELTVTKPNTMRFLQKCVEEIQKEYLAPTDLIIYLNLNENFKNLQLTLLPVVIQNNHLKEQTRFRLAKADAYVITVSEKLINGTFEFLITTSQWNPRAKFVVILEGNPSSLFQTLNKYYVFNVVALVSKSWVKTEIFTYLPYTFSMPENKSTKAVLIDVCLEGNLREKIHLFPEKLPTKWSNTTVRVILLEYPPYVICYDCEEEKKRGIEVNLFQLVRSVLDFKIHYMNKPYDGWGPKRPNGSYEGAFGDLQTYEADVGIGLFYLNYTENWDFDLTFPYMEDSSKWIVPAAKLQPPWKSIAEIFSWYIWMLVVTSLVVTSLALYFVAINLYETESYRKFLSCFTTCFQCLMGQPVRRFPKMVAARMIFAVWIIFNCVISTAFQSNLTKVLNSQTYGRQISTLQEMIDSKLEFGFFKSVAFLFSDTDCKTDSFIYRHYTSCPLGSSCVDRVAFKGDFATIKAKRYLQYLISKYYLGSDGRPLIYILEGKVYNILVTMAFSRGFPMFEQVNKLLLHAKSSGFIQYHYNRVEDFTTKAEMQAKAAKMKADVLDLNELEGVFEVLLLGWFLAFLVFVVELVAKQMEFVDLQRLYTRTSGATMKP